MDRLMQVQKKDAETMLAALRTQVRTEQGQVAEGAQMREKQQEQELHELKEALKSSQQQLGYIEVLLDESIAECLKLHRTVNQKVQDLQVSFA